MGIYIMGLYGYLMGDLMGFYGDLMGFTKIHPLVNIYTMENHHVLLGKLNVGHVIR